MTNPHGGGYLDFAQRLALIPHPKTRRLGPALLHPAAVAVLTALDQRDQEGLRLVRELVLHWFRQSGKTTLDAIIALYGLTSDPFHTDRLVVIAANDVEQGMRVFEQAKRMAARQPLLSKARFLKDEAIFSSIERDPKTGGSFKSDHRLRVLATGDIRGAHGMRISTAILDEFWVWDDYGLVEPLTHSPALACPLTVYSSYSGLRSQQKAGVPLFDLIERGKRGDDPAFYYSYLGAADWFSVPWVTPQWIERVRRQLATAPARFARLIENRVAAADDAFITDDELQAAISLTLVEPQRGSDGITYSAGLDIGLTGAWTGLVLGHADVNGGFVVDALRHWQGTPGHPVNLDLVEREILFLAERFPLRTLEADPWQGVHLAQRLERLGVPVHLAPVDARRVDRLTTLVKQLFVQRMMKFSAQLLPLREQLEGMTVTESKSRGLLRFEGGGTTGASAHSDLVFGLGLACEGLGGALGKTTLPEMPGCESTACYREQSLDRPVPCYLWVNEGGYVPGGDPSCKACPAHQSVLTRWREDSRGLGLREYRAVYGGDNSLTKIKKQRLAYRALQDWADGVGF